MPRLTKRNGDGEGDLIACFSCNYEARPVEDCGLCPHIKAAIEKLCCLEDAQERRLQIKEEEYD